MQRTVIDLSTDWLYAPRDVPAAAGLTCDEAGFAPVSIPHTNVELPHHNFSEQAYCFVSWYRKWFYLPADIVGRRVFLDFEGVMVAAKVYVNGELAGAEHRGGYTPFSLDVTEWIAPGQQNLLSVRVDSTERPDIPPFGGVVDYLAFGGIYREVALRVVGPIYIKDIFAVPKDVLEDRKSVDISATIVNTTDQEIEIDLSASIGGGAASINGDLELPARGQAKITFGLPGLEAQLWDLDNPTLYEAAVELENGDRLATRVGFRTIEFGRGAFRLNGRPIKLRGLNRHQTFPYIGAAAPARLQVRDALVLKYDLACNIVRTSHYPPSRHFLDACDEIGLLVFEEMPGWQFIGDQDWQQLSLRDVQAMIVRDRNRPSVVLWGVRINESCDNHEFYTRTNELARRLDPSRPTGGVRAHADSEFLEDVYTMNDFGWTLDARLAAAHDRYLNTEYCGHMYPAKPFDPEERVRQHALAHAGIVNQIAGMNSAGGIGWCAFDYNTHAMFGSGDRICYHGVMDIFREPKFAAHFYAAFADPDERVVLEPATYWKRGDQSGGGVDPLVVFGNVEEVEILLGDDPPESRGRFKPRRDLYPRLTRPPFIIEGVSRGTGHAWKTLTIVGYIKGEPVATRRVAADGVPQCLVVSPDDPELDADGADMTRVALRITDQFGNVLPFAIRPVSLKIEGPGVLVGENPFPMPGGRGAVYVRATRKPGTVTVTASTAGLAAQTITIQTVEVGQ
jgi:beta-galactosidase